MRGLPPSDASGARGVRALASRGRPAAVAGPSGLTRRGHPAHCHPCLRLHPRLPHTSRHRRVPGGGSRRATGDAPRPIGRGTDAIRRHTAGAWLDARPPRTARLLAQAALLEGLRPFAHWNPPYLDVDYPVDRELRLEGRGLMLVPSYFCWRRPMALADPGLDPVLVYPVKKQPLELARAGEERGQCELSDRRPARGRTRRQQERREARRAHGDVTRPQPAGRHGDDTSKRIEGIAARAGAWHCFAIVERPGESHGACRQGRADRTVGTGLVLRPGCGVGTGAARDDQGALAGISRQAPTDDQWGK